ncbi:MAG: adenosine deaminase [Microthrixaceae bacterium]
MRDLLALPKGHLHLHLEGGMRPSTLVDLAEAAGIGVPVVSGFGSFTAFADMYVAACEVLRTPDDLARLVDEAVEDASLSGSVWFEPSFYPPHHRERLGPDDEVVEIVLEALAAAADRHGVACGLMLASDRTQPVSEAIVLAELAVRYADRGVVSFGLANDEVLGAPEAFAPAYDIIRDAGLLSTPHAGELCGPESVRGALDALGADRLQHGVRAVEDPALLARLAEEQVCCDVCPSSNVLLSVSPDLAGHQLVAMLEAGVPCSLNADDPLLFGPGLLEEYEVCRSEMGLSDDQLATIARASVGHSGAPDSLKATAAKDIDSWLTAT